MSEDGGHDGVAGYRGRFAPSPTGLLHFGSLLTAFASWLRARQAGGTWLIRIEDLDPPREVAGASDAQIDTLRRFGFESDEVIMRQSERAVLYEAALTRLQQHGFAFDCRCSRSDLAAQHGIHRHCVDVPHARAAAIRARVPAIEIAFDDAVQGMQRQSLARDVGDFVLRRVEGYFAYQLAVVVDDAAQGISEIVRGADLLDSTPRQIWLQQQLGFATPGYVHLPLALDRDGEKLGKSQRAAAVQHEHVADVLRAAWQFLGQDVRRLPAAGNAADLRRTAIEAFDLQRVPSRSAISHM